MTKKHANTPRKGYVPSRPLPKVRNPIWSIERAMAEGHYINEPHNPAANFSGPLRMSRPGFDCAIQYQGKAWGTEHGCKEQCDECSHICHMNDYIRGKLPAHYPVPATTENARFAQYPQWIADCYHWQAIGWADNV